MQFQYYFFFFQDGFSIKFKYPLGDVSKLIRNFALVHLPALRALDLGMNYHRTGWPIISTTVPLTYLRLCLSGIDILLRLMTTTPLSNTLRQLHIRLIYNDSHKSTPNLSISMVKLHTFSLIEVLSSMITIEWAVFEMLTSSKVMPVLRRANVSLCINTNDLYRIGSSPIFIDHRCVDINFAFRVIDYPQYMEVTPFIPCGHRSHPREIVGATLFINDWSDRSERVMDVDPFVSYSSVTFCFFVTIRLSTSSMFISFFFISRFVGVNIIIICGTLFHGHSMSSFTNISLGNGLQKSIYFTYHLEK